MVSLSFSALPLPASCFHSSDAFGDYLLRLDAAGEDPALAIDVLEAGLLAVGEKPPALAEMFDRFHQTTSKEARQKFNRLIAGTLHHPAARPAAQRALAFWRSHLPWKSSLPFPAAAPPSPPAQKEASLSSPSSPFFSQPPGRFAAASPSANAAFQHRPPPWQAEITAGLFDNSNVLLYFQSYQALDSEDKILLQHLWEAYNRYVEENRKSKIWWKVHPEYERDPLAVGRDVAERMGMEVPRDLLELHHQIRRAWARHQKGTFTVSRRSKTYSISCLVIPAPTASSPCLGKLGTPCLDKLGTPSNSIVAVDQLAIDKTLQRFENAFGPLSPPDRSWYEQALIRVEAARRFFRRKEPSTPGQRSKLVGKMFPERRKDERQTLLLLWGVLDWIQSEIPEEERVRPLLADTDLWAFAKAVANILRCSPYFLVEEIGTSWHKKNYPYPDRPAELSKIVKIFNLLDIRSPEKILLRLFPEELRWAFPHPFRRDGRTVFALPSETDLPTLVRSGVGPLLNGARISRGIVWHALSRLFEKQTGTAIHFSMLAHYGTNRFAPPFHLLKDLVEIFEGIPSGERVHREQFFLAVYPAFAQILPLVTPTGKILNGPPLPPYQGAAYPHAQAGRLYAIVGRPPLDPKGFPSKIRQRRVQLNLNQKTGAKRIDFNNSSLGRLERDPTPNSPNFRVPERRTVARLAAKEGFGLPVGDLLRRHEYTYWRHDPMVQMFKQRTFQTPVLIDESGYRRLKKLAGFPFRTPGEILFYWRNSTLLLPSCPFVFPPGVVEMAKFLGVVPSTYAEWERGMKVPWKNRARDIVERLGVSQLQAKNFFKACERMREELKKKRRESDRPSPKNRPTLPPKRKKSG